MRSGTAPSHRSSPTRKPPKQSVLDKYGYTNSEQFLNWRWFAKYGGGPMVDLGSHQIDLFFWVWGVPPSSVTAIGGTDAFSPRREAYDRVMCLYEFQMPDGTKNEAYYQVISSNARGGFYEQFMGTHASLTIAEISARATPCSASSRGVGPTRNGRPSSTGVGFFLGATTRSRRKSRRTWVDTRISGLANGNPLPIELNKPAHIRTSRTLAAFAMARSSTARPSCDESAVAVLAANVPPDSRKTHYFKPEDSRSRRVPRLPREA